MRDNLVTYKLKLKPTLSQEKKLEQWLGVCRLIYNLALETKIQAFERKRVNLSRYDLQYQVTDLSKGYDWIRDVASIVRQDPLVRLEKSFRFYKKGNGFPKFAKKSNYKSFNVSQGVKIKGDSIYLTKFGCISFFKGNRDLSNLIIKKACVVKGIDGWFISLIIEKKIDEFIPNDNKIGLDVGISKYLVTSEGEVIGNPVIGKYYESKLRIAQRKISRRKKGSARRNKSVLELKKLHLKISNKRKDHLHKLSTKLVSENQAIIVEDLKISNMIKSAKGTINNPGKNVKQKSGLNKALSDLSISEFFRMLEYKSEWYGREFIKVDPKYTSQICSRCGNKDKESRKSQSEFKCTNCGLELNADYNAAINIKGRAYPSGDISEITCEPENKY